MPQDVHAARIAAEAPRIAIHPCDRAPHLVDHGEQALLGVLHAFEIRNDEMSAGPYEHLGGICVFRRGSALPRSAVDEHGHRRPGVARAIDIELLDRRRAVALAQRGTEAHASKFTRLREARHELVAVGRIDRLVVGVVQLLLVVVEENARPLDAGGPNRGLIVHIVRGLCHLKQ